MIPPKPTYGELEERVRKLEKQSLEHKNVKKTLRSERDKLKTLIDGLASTGIGVDIVSFDHEIIQQNQTLVDRFGDKVGKKCYKEYMALEEPCSSCPMVKALKNKRLEKAALRGADGRDYKILSAPVTNPDGTVDKAIEVILDISNLKQTEEALRESESKLSAMLASVGDHMSMMDKDLNILWANEIAEKIFGNDIIGKKCYEVYHKRTEPCEPYPCITLRAFQNGKIHEHDTQVVDKDGNTIFFHCTANVALRDKEGKPTAVLEISRDITEKVRVGKALHKAKNELERRVEERTRELEMKTENLEEINIAMRVLLKKRQEDKTEIEDNVLTNVKELIAPYFKKINKTKLDDQQKTFFSIIESNLNEIISPFTRKMSLKYLNLTPAEIRIANLIRHGIPNKEIAELLNLSPRTVETHRKNIRRKIGLEGKRANLRSHLLSLH